ncbi:hypothetical protein KKH3_26250 [Pectobacterium actinidiae]|nr:hypothetical protein KKH3_26250 [Pectobacterium actinidiae]
MISLSFPCDALIISAENNDSFESKYRYNVDFALPDLDAI